MIQANVNHTKEAQDLLLQTMSERKCTLGIVSEPHRVPKDHPLWTSDTTSTVAITWKWWRGAPVCTPLKQGTHYVAVKWQDVIVIGVYFPPSGTFADYESWLEDIALFIEGMKGHPIVLGGDFNAWHTIWDSRATNLRGKTLYEWVISIGLKLLNEGHESTCVRPQGSLVVDLTWATLSAHVKLLKWEVLTDMENLSDHRYIAVRFGDRRIRDLKQQTKGSVHVKWAQKRIDEDRFMTTVVAAVWSHQTSSEDPTEEAAWVQDTVTRACNASMIKVTAKPRCSTYWWTEEIAELRRTALK